MNHPLIIGAGGVASYFLPVFIKAFHPAKLTIVDKDKLEERNLDRQMFKPSDIGMFKASALAIQHWHKTDSKGTCIDLNIIYDWFTPELVIPEDIDMIICVADNHQARHDALERADLMNIPCVIGGNEYFDSEAYIYYPRWRGGIGDPRIRHPELLTPDIHESPLSCQGTAQTAAPQLAVANFCCASKLLQLLWTYERWFFGQAQILSPHIFVTVASRLPYELTTSIHESTRYSFSEPGHYAHLQVSPPST